MFLYDCLCKYKYKSKINQDEKYKFIRNYNDAQIVLSLYIKNKINYKKIRTIITNRRISESLVKLFQEFISEMNKFYPIYHNKKYLFID